MTSQIRLLGEVEQLLLLAILRLGEGTYAVPIRAEIARETGVELTRGTIYVTLDRLEQKGYVTSWFEDPTPEPGGKSKRCYRIEREGIAALKSARLMIDRLEAGTVLAGKARWR